MRLDWPTVMFDDILHQLVSGSLPLQGWQFNVGEHWKPWERCGMEGARDDSRPDLCELSISRLEHSNSTERQSR